MCKPSLAWRTEREGIAGLPLAWYAIYANRGEKRDSIQKHCPIERVALDGLEAGVADDAAQLFFGGAV